MKTETIEQTTRWAPVVALALAMLVVTSDASVAAVALPNIGVDLGVGPAATSWVLLAYALPMAALSIPAGRWIDRADPRLIFLLSMIGVGVTSVLAALAPTLWLLLVARLLQGIAGGLTLAVYMPVIAASVRADQRGRAISSVVTIMTIGGMVGASLGGLVAGGLGWRAVFLMKLPLLVVVLWLSLRAFPSNGKGLPWPGAAVLRESAVLGGAIAAALVAFNQQPLVAVVALVLGVVWVRLPASRPVITLVRGRRFGLTMSGLFLMCFNGAVMVFLLPYFVSDVLHRGPEVTGVLLLVNIGAMSVVSPLAGWLADRFGPIPVATAGAALTAVATLVLVTLGADATLVDVGWRLAVMGAAFGIFNSPIIAAIMATAPKDATATAGGVSGTARMIAMTVAPAVMVLCWNLAGGGVAGFHSGLIVLTAIEVVGVLVLLGT